MIQRMFVLFGLILTAGALSAEPLIDGDPQAGESKAVTCTACHGPAGNSVNPQWPKLAGQHAAYLEKQLRHFKSGVRDNAIMMGQAAALGEQDIKDLAAYYAKQQTTVGVTDESLAAAGKAVYFGGRAEDAVPACAGCHGPAGLGNAAAGYPHLSGQHAEYVAARLRAYRDGAVADTPHAQIMAGVAAGLSDKDIEAVSAFVTGLRPAAGGE